jgi:hypothetical protein
MARFAPKVVALGFLQGTAPHHPKMGMVGIPKNKSTKYKTNQFKIFMRGAYIQSPVLVMDNKADNILPRYAYSEKVGLWSLWRGLRSELFANELC